MMHMLLWCPDYAPIMPWWCSADALIMLICLYCILYNTEYTELWSYMSLLWKYSSGHKACIKELLAEIQLAFMYSDKASSENFQPVADSKLKASHQLQKMLDTASTFHTRLQQPIPFSISRTAEGNPSLWWIYILVASKLLRTLLKNSRQPLENLTNKDNLWHLQTSTIFILWVVLAQPELYI